MPSRKVSMRASMANQTSHLGIMGGLAKGRTAGASGNRATNKLVIPRGAAKGLAYMQMRGILSRNPQGSGGVGKVVKSKPCNCKGLGKTKVEGGDLGGDLGGEGSGGVPVSQKRKIPVTCNGASAAWKNHCYPSGPTGASLPACDHMAPGFPTCGGVHNPCPTWQPGSNSWMDTPTAQAQGTGTYYMGNGWDGGDNRPLDNGDPGPNCNIFGLTGTPMTSLDCECPPGACFAVDGADPAYWSDRSFGTCMKADDCSFGRWLDSDGMCTLWTTCASGQYAVGGTPNVDVTCSNCPAGQSSVAGGLCTDCPAGQSSVAGGLCTDCPAGQSSVAGGLCTDCPAGTHSDTGSMRCVNCSAGTSSGAGHAGWCNICPKGTYSDTSGATTCTECRIGTYSNNVGATSCSDCSNGITVDGSGLYKEKGALFCSPHLICPSTTVANDGAGAYTHAAGADDQGYFCCASGNDGLFNLSDTPDCSGIGAAARAGGPGWVNSNLCRLTGPIAPGACSKPSCNAALGCSSLKDGPWQPGNAQLRPTSCASTVDPSPGCVSGNCPATSCFSWVNGDCQPNPNQTIPSPAMLGCSSLDVDGKTYVPGGKNAECTPAMVHQIGSGCTQDVKTCPATACYWHGGGEQGGPSCQLNPYLP
jgi:hypothetical protein